jgi:hypothetical protein
MFRWNGEMINDCEESESRKTCRLCAPRRFSPFRVSASELMKKASRKKSIMLSKWRLRQQMLRFMSARICSDKWPRGSNWIAKELRSLRGVFGSFSALFMKNLRQTQRATAASGESFLDCNQKNIFRLIEPSESISVDCRPQIRGISLSMNNDQR